LARFAQARAPAHAYYSTAYYQDPVAPTMQEKGWMGAELIFDLDADHVPGSERLPYDEQLRVVKDHFIRLVDEFIGRDFGFGENDVVLTFSGGRGYHAHVVAPAALSLTATERREIVDYITGTQLDVNVFLGDATVSVKGRSGFERPVKSLRIASERTMGWGGRLNRQLVAYLDQLRRLDKEDVETRLKDLPGIGAKRAQEGADEIARLNLDRVRQGYLDQGGVLRIIIPHVLEQYVVPLAKGETDEPVTSDTKRLIRLPGSLHGKTGLRVVTLTRDELERFDPLVDAVALGEEPVSVRVTKPLAFTLRSETYDLKPGDAIKMPEAAAAFAVARGACEPVL
jgi:DNA primase small subunit